MAGDTEPALQLVDVLRRFADRVAVDHVSLRLDRGQVLALLGPNGAGKTTTVRMASTLLTPDAGQIQVAGVDALRHPRQARAHTGLVLGGDRGFYMRASAVENLRFFADVAAVPGRRREAMVRSALEAVSLHDRADDKVSSFSRGMVQRLHLARALTGEPALLLLDEPTNGLDVAAARDVRAVVRTLTDRGCGVLLTTHIMAEAETLADRIDVIDHGRITVTGTTSEVAEAAGVHAVSMVVLAGDLAPTQLDALTHLPAVKAVNVTALHGRTAVAVVWGQNANPELLEPFTHGANVTTRPPTLEESYLALMDGSA